MMNVSFFGLLVILLGLVLVVLLVLGVVAVVLLIRNNRGREEHTALDILNERYARGEIDQAEYEEMRARLEHV